MKLIYIEWHVSLLSKKRKKKLMRNLFKQNDVSCLYYSSKLIYTLTEQKFKHKAGPPTASPRALKKRNFSTEDFESFFGPKTADSYPDSDSFDEEF